jgi:SEL1 protein
MYEETITLYAEPAETALTSSFISKETPVSKPVQLHGATEENKETLRMSRGEDDEDFQTTEYQAEQSNDVAIVSLIL